MERMRKSFAQNAGTKICPNIPNHGAIYHLVGVLESA